MRQPYQRCEKHDRTYCTNPSCKAEEREDSRSRTDLTTTVAANLQKLDGSTESAVSLLTGISREEIAELGGISE